MGIHFNAARWEAIREPFARWWDGTLDRNIIQVTVTDAYEPERDIPCAPLLTQETCNMLEYDPRDIIDRLDYEFSRQEYLGEAFPRLGLECFGPGILAAFCGARLDNSSGTVWLFPEEKLPIKEIKIKYDSENIWVRRMKAIIAAGHERWRGNVLIGQPDLGGVPDCVAVFRGTQDLLTDFYDEPDEVLRLISEAESAWMEAFNDFYDALAATHIGRTDWMGLYSERRHSTLQSDISYMISNEMFRKFILPGLGRMFAAIPDNIYHLDGKGELPHLDSLLEDKNMKAVQWVFGDGSPRVDYWHDLYKKIYDAGRGGKIESCRPDEYVRLSALLPRMQVVSRTILKEQRAEVIKKYGIKEWGE